MTRATLATEIKSLLPATYCTATDGTLLFSEEQSDERFETWRLIAQDCAEIGAPYAVQVRRADRLRNVRVRLMDLEAVASAEKF